MTPKTEFLDNTSLIRQYKSGSREALDTLTKSNMKLVISIARRFTLRGYELEDLVQTGTMGLLKAIEGFDESLGYSFSTYAYPLIAGEIKRFLRDDGPIKVSRITKSNALRIMNARNEFLKTNLREPKLSELCEITKLSTEEVTDAIDISRPALSLEDKISNNGSETTVKDTVADFDTIGMMTDRMALKQEIERLEPLERRIIHLRFFKNLTQTQTAELLGISQVTVSRSERRIINKLRQKIL